MYSRLFASLQKFFSGNKRAARPYTAYRRTDAIRLAFAFLAALICSATTANAQLTDVTCGGEGDRICSTADEAYHVANTRSNAGTVCDYGLLPMPNFKNPTELVCSDLTRHRLGNILNTTDPRGFVIHEQEQAIGADVPINLVNTLGTHNSYSNYTEGYNEDYHILHFDLSTLSFTTVDDPFAADQYYSISDQLSAGARTVRLDPYYYNGQMRMCHGAMYCNNTSDGRLFVYAVREIADWLNAHPGEFVIIRLQDNHVTPTQQYMENDPIEKYLAPYLYQPSDGQPGYLSENGTTVWPTLRQLRANGSKGRQAMIFSMAKSLPSYAWSNGQFLTNNTSAKNLVPGQNLNLGEACKDDNGNDTRRRSILGWNKVGEDRSGSTTVVETTSSFPFFETTNQFGLMDSPQTNMAAKCGASVIDLDFWGALNHAFHFDVDVLGKEVTLVDFRGPSDDFRPLDASWSYILNDSAVGPAALDENTQTWVSVPESFHLRYACATQRETPDVYEGLYAWEITSTSGTWSGGEAACQKLGSQYHFWFPQDVYEQSNILRYDLAHRAELNGVVWLNYRSATTGHQMMTAPQQISVTTPAGVLPASQTIWTSGGVGGKLKITSTGPFEVTQQTVGGWPTNQLVLTPKSGAFSGIETITQKVEIQEFNPATGALSPATTVPVRVTITDALAASETKIYLTPGSEQVIQITDQQGAQNHIPFTIAGAPSWLVVEQSENSTPAQVKIVAETAAKGVYLGSFELVPSGPDAGTAPTTISVQYVVQ
jgi:hypothetical protein